MTLFYIPTKCFIKRKWTYQRIYYILKNPLWTTLLREVEQQLLCRFGLSKNLFCTTLLRELEHQQTCANMINEVNYMLICCIWTQFRVGPYLQVAYKFMVKNVYSLSTWFIDIIFSIWNNVQKSPSIKKIEKTMWETLNTTQNVDEKVVRGDQNYNWRIWKWRIPHTYKSYEGQYYCYTLVRSQSPFGSWLICLFCYCEATYWIKLYILSTINQDCIK
jgi:hypothetical protein